MKRIFVSFIPVQKTITCSLFGLLLLIVTCLYSPTDAYAWTCGNETVTFNYKGQNVTYGTILRDYGSGNLACWLDRNLGAARAALDDATYDGYNDTQSYGDLFQWGREDDGHQNRNSTQAQGDQSFTSQPGNSTYYIEGSDPYDWANPTWTSRWTISEADPCPEGWSVPSETQWQTEINTWTSPYRTSAFQSLKISLGGKRDGFNGMVAFGDTDGFYWTSTSHLNSAHNVQLSGTGNSLGMVNSFRSSGFAVRCIKDSYTPPPPNSAPASPTSLSQVDLAQKTDVANNSYTSNEMRFYASATDADENTQISLFFAAIPVMGAFSYPDTPTAETTCGEDVNYNDCDAKIWYVTSTSSDYSTSAYEDYVNVRGFPDNNYIWKVKACDESSNCSEWVAFDVQTPNFTVDTVIPQISNIRTEATNRTDERDINWDTSEDTTSQVQIGLTPEFAYGSLLPERDVDALTSDHTYRVGELGACTTYYYRVISNDAAQNQTTSDPGYFITPGCPGNSTVDAISSSNQIINFDTGGTASLTDNNETILLDIPQNYFDDLVFQEQTIPADPAVFQIKKIDKSQFLTSSTTPSDELNAIGNQVYHLTAKVDYYASRSDFAHPVTISMQYSPSSIGSMDENTLWIYRFDDTSWHALDNCTVNKSTKTVTCTTTNFSTFVLFGQELSAPNSPSSSSSNQSNSNSGSAASCSDPKPVSVPDLFEIDTTTNDAKLFFTPLADTNTYYISYSTNPNAEEHGEKVQLLREGVQSHQYRQMLPYH